MTETKGQLDTDTLRAMECAIMEGKPAPLDPADLDRLKRGDHTLGPALDADALRHPCYGPCSAERPCTNCLGRRRWCALLLQRERHGRPEPSSNGQAAGDAVPIVRRLSDVQAEPVRWLARGWIPRGSITLLDGDPGLGKSTITASWAAAVSRGWGWPQGSPASDPAGVLLLSAEDDVARTIRPRLEAAGADLSRCHTLEAILYGTDDIPPTLPGDLDHIRAIVERERVALVVIDPLMAYLSSQVDAHRDQDVRRALQRLALLASDTDIAVVIVRHLNKLVTVGTALYRGGGSIGIIGAARSALLVGRDPERLKTRVLAPAKANLGPMPRSLTYSLEPHGDVAVVAWGEPCDLTADDILARPAGRQRETAGQQAADAIRQLLADGPVPAEDVRAELARRGYGGKAIRAAYQLAGVQSRREGFPGRAVWCLAASAPPQDGDHPEDPGRDPFADVP